ncbi:MAG: hypothetical protein H6765_01815 [Candidatus Peribacteria bacterium]|nr:MAG: hypothetical protein H6765_01815 [Candidatus Peribacteria bacterium]
MEHRNTIAQQLATVETIMQDCKIYLSTHHDNTDAVDQRKTNALKIALTLCADSA